MNGIHRRHTGKEWVAAGILPGLLVLAGCGTAHYQRSADKTAAATIADKGKAVPNMDPNFTIEEEKMQSLEHLPRVSQPEEAFGAESNMELGARIINLEQALDLAVKHNRTYLSRKEQLYLQALGLSLSRHSYTPIFSGGVRGTYNDNAATRQFDQVTITNIGGITRFVTNSVDQIVRDRGASGGISLGADVLLRSGARIAADFTSDFSRFLILGPRVAASSRLAASITQPLLKGAGYKIAMENLTQSERDMLYALRDFVQFRKDFSVQTVTAYYGVLQARDAVRNNWRSLQAFKRNAERTRALVKVGKARLSDLGQLEQQELSAESSWIGSVRNYRRSLDQFKIQLGLPVDAQIVMDGDDLRDLKIAHPNVAVDDAVQIALANRLDLYTVRERHEDAERKVKIAANALLPKLDFVASASAATVEGQNQPFNFDWGRYRWNAGLDLELPLERTAERNSYRSALINFQRSIRERALAEDNVKQSITDDWRSLDQAKRDYEINVLGVRLAEKRVEEEELKSKLGRGTARDLVDAQNALTASRNALTAAVIRHLTARLQFWKDMGILMIRENGGWEEITNVESR